MSESSAEHRQQQLRISYCQCLILMLKSFGLQAEDCDAIKDREDLEAALRSI